jgi:hypothetical protein
MHNQRTFNLASQSVEAIELLPWPASVSVSEPPLLGSAPKRGGRYQ